MDNIWLYSWLALDWQRYYLLTLDWLTLDVEQVQKGGILGDAMK